MTDDKLLEQLFQPMKEMQVADDGFTDCVVQRLPQRDVRGLSRLWTVFCVVVAAALFVWIRGWEIIGYGLMMLMNHPPTSQQLLLFGVSAVVVWVMVVADILSRERYSVI